MEISQFRQILAFTANFISSPLGVAAAFDTAKWWLNSASFELFGGEFRHLASLVAPPPWRNCWRSDKKPDWRPTSCSSPQLRIPSQIHRIRIWTIEKSVSWSTCKIDSHISSLSSIPLNKMSPTLQKKPSPISPLHDKKLFDQEIRIRRCALHIITAQTST